MLLEESINVQVMHWLTHTRNGATTKVPSQYLPHNSFSVLRCAVISYVTGQLDTRFYRIGHDCPMQYNVICISNLQFVCIKSI